MQLPQLNQPRTAPIFPQVEDMIRVNKSELLRRIRDMVVIMNDLVQEPMFKNLEGVTIPYYAVGIDEEITQELRTYFAEMIYNATFGCGRTTIWPAKGICGADNSCLPETSITLAHWIATAQHLTMTERDHINTFCNPTRYIPGQGFYAWGSGGYVNGQWYANLVCADSIKYLLGFQDRTHVVIPNE